MNSVARLIRSLGGILPIIQGGLVVYKKSTVRRNSVTADGRLLTAKINVSRIKFPNVFTLTVRRFCSDECGEEKKGLILGVYEGESPGEIVFTKAASKYNDKLHGKLCELVKKAGPQIRLGTGRTFNHIDKEFWAVAVVGLGRSNLGYNELETLDEGMEAVRQAAGCGSRALKNQGVTRILIEGLGFPEQAAEGSALALWRYQENRSRQYWQIIPTLELFDDCDSESFQRGLFKAESQNLARRLSDTPANQMTPLHFAQETVNELCPCGIKVMVHDKDWIELKKLNAFLTVARGSCEPPVFLEISYCGAPADQKPVLMVGSGVTFDSGGLCIKECKKMRKYRADMSGAAAVIAAIRAASALSLPMNIEGCIPLCENMPSGMAMKCGDIVVGKNGKAINVKDCDHEGRLMTADAIRYGQDSYHPRLIIDVGSFTGGTKKALGQSASAVFTNSQQMWAHCRRAGVITGDRVWRMPLWKFFNRKITKFPNYDVCNKGKGFGSACLAAAFIREFVECVDWIHFDISGVGFLMEDKELTYLTQNRMTGRPTRTLIQLLYQLSCPSGGMDKKPKECPGT